MAYGKTGETFKVRVGRQIVYLETGSDNSLYYEYQPVTFIRPEKGWNTAKKDLGKLAWQIGNRLSMKSAEARKLALERELAASKVNSDKLFVGPIDQAEVDEKVALAVIPAVPVFRYHFYVGKAGDITDSPVISPVTRSSRMVIEVGAVSSEAGE